MAMSNNKTKKNNRDRDRKKKMKNEKNITQNIEDREDRFIIGAKIIKKFSGVAYEGHIIKYEDQYYKIKYSDGDSEDLTHYQVSRFLKNKPKNRQRRRNR